MTSNPVLSKPRMFYGWFVVAAAFAVTFVGFGSAYTFSAFVESLQKDFAASRGSVSLVFSLAGFLYFGLGIVSGPLADRWGSRRMAVIGMLLIGMAWRSRARLIAWRKSTPHMGLASDLASGAPTFLLWAPCNAGSSGAAALPPDLPCAPGCSASYRPDRPSLGRRD